jgi:hypothetical protein
MSLQSIHGREAGGYGLGTRGWEREQAALRATGFFFPNSQSLAPSPQPRVSKGTSLTA